MNTEQNIFITLLSLLKVKYTREFADKLFNEHPHKYNLFGLSTMLESYGIETAGIRIDNKEEIYSIDTPFIAHTGNGFVVITKLIPNAVTYIWRGKKINTSLEEFNKIWSGIILLVEAKETSGEPNYKENRKKELFRIGQRTLLLLSLAGLIAVACMSTQPYMQVKYVLSFILNLTGIYASYLLLLKQMHIQSNYADKICSLFGKSDCNNVLESPGAKFLGVINWSEVGLGYFISNTGILLFAPPLIPYIALINICTLPYSVWSVWYQKFKAKQWCPICLLVQGLLWGIFAVNAVSNWIQIPTFDLMNLLTLAGIYLIPFLLTGMIVPGLVKSSKMEQITWEMNSIKMKDEVFTTLLKRQPRYLVNKQTSQILFGNPNAPLLITILTNPHCNPCALMHKRVEKLLKEFENKVCVQYIFASFNDELESSNHILTAVYLRGKEEETIRIYRDWFEGGKLNKETFLSKYTLNPNEETVREEVKKHKLWKDETKLRATPMILVNGYELPDSYQIEELKYFLNLEVNTEG